MDKANEKEVVVAIVGAGPSGLATAACLNRLSIANIVLEREDCSASLWRKRSYDRLKLHLAKQFCELPHMPFPSNSPKFVPRDQFIEYLDNYKSRFEIKLYCRRSVESASYDDRIGKWRIVARNTGSGEDEVYVAEFLVVASGENSEGVIPEVDGLDSFGRAAMHSSEYRKGREFRGKNVLVVGCGNSGMEIAYDLWSHGANTSIVARSPVHVVTKEMVFLGMVLLKFLPCRIVDTFVIQLSNLKYGDFFNYGLRMPEKGPFYLKAVTGRSPTIDVGAMKRIRKGEIRVFPSIKSINGKLVTFVNGTTSQFEAIVFATGYKSTVRKWLQGGDDLFNKDGMTKVLRQWKGENGLYCTGFAQRGLLGISADARNVADDISFKLRCDRKCSRRK
ncbi:probable indole-3-pyruvate monooxygenase YUCCA10 [Syzygium oleosum]|uniref:probable indole-3-pyruvate monooxygenase YUCCA10 n=1 Tax=Syzygium oleosum TaxID=219896 RepID=UPI0024B99F92|nr:probable indole-3-pyruvate monooxygenase YUCCA10 [Syzygium oleosum]